MRDVTYEEINSATWILTIRGILAIIFGIAAVFWPGITLVTLVYLFATYILVIGIVDIVDGISSIRTRSWWLVTLALGLLQVGVGVYLLRHPLLTFATLILLIGFVLIARGIFEGVMALVSGQDSAPMRTLTVVMSILSVAAGILMLFQPASAGVAFVWILGLYALVVGPVLIALAMEARHSFGNSKNGRKLRRA